MSVSRLGSLAAGALLVLASFGAHATLVGSESAFNTAVPNRGLDDLNGFFEQNPGPLDLAFVETAGSFAGLTGVLTAASTGGATSEATSDNNGRFFPGAANTFWDAAGEDFSIKFNIAITAIGFDWADVGDFTGADDGQGSGAAASGAALTVCLSNNAAPGGSGDSCGHIVGSTFDNGQGFSGVFDSTPGAGYLYAHFINNTVGLDGQAFDNFRAGRAAEVTPPNRTPEPASLALIGMGLLGLSLRRRR